MKSLIAIREVCLLIVTGVGERFLGVRGFIGLFVTPYQIFDLIKISKKISMVELLRKLF